MKLKTYFNEGAINMMQATIWFALMNVFAKLVNHLPTMEVVFFRCFISAALCYYTLMKYNIPVMGSNLKMLIARGATGTVSLYLYFLTLHKMPLGTAVTIQYMSPIFAVIIAMFIVNERITVWQWLFFLVSFSGVLLIKGFDNRVSMLHLAYGIGSAILSGVSYNLVRSMKHSEHPTVIVFHFMFLGSIVSLIFCLFQWTMPVGRDWFYLLMIGVTTQFAQMKMTRSLQSSNIGDVTILNYIGVIYALVTGWLIFGETYGINALLGIILVIAGVIFNVIYTKGKVAKA